MSLTTLDAMPIGTSGHMMQTRSVSGFRFRIDATGPSIDGTEGTLIAGVRVDGGDVAVGDRLRIALSSGDVDVVVSGFPLIRWDDPSLRSIAVTGLPPEEAVVGAVAVRIDGGA